MIKLDTAQEIKIWLEIYQKTEDPLSLEMLEIYDERRSI